MKPLYAVIVLISIFAIASCGEDKDSANKQTAEKPFAGQSIVVIVPKLHARLIRGPIMDEAKVFEASTGATVRVVTPGWNETIEKIDQSLVDENLNYDIYVVIAMWNGTLLGNGHIAPVPDWVKKKIEWEDVLPIYRNTVLSWNNVAYGMPYDGDCINLYYRKDVFENADVRDRFKKRYGYDLAAPVTWDQYHDMAAFFTGWDWDNDGRDEYGIAGNRVKGDISMLQFFAQAAAFAKDPGDKAYYFDPDTLKPRINNPGFVKALEFFIETMNYGPPGMANFAGHDVRNSFVSGEVAMAIDWADMGVYAVDSPISTVKDKVGYGQLPGSDQYFDATTQAWEAGFNQVSSISGNWMFLVSKASKHKDLAFEFAAHMTSKEVTGKLVALSGNAVNPSRHSHFQDAASWNQSGFSTASARAYLDEITKSLSNTNVVYDITIPGAAEYYQAVDTLVNKAIVGEISAQAALDQAAEAWEEITDKLGREKQIAFYKASLNVDR